MPQLVARHKLQTGVVVVSRCFPQSPIYRFAQALLLVSSFPLIISVPPPPRYILPPVLNITGVHLSYNLNIGEMIEILLHSYITLVQNSVKNLMKGVMKDYF